MVAGSNPPRVVMINFWRDDAKREIEERVDHLFSKTYPNLRYLWSVGDSTDETEEILRRLAEGKDVEFCDSTTNIEGRKMPERLRRLSKMASITFQRIREDDDIVILHESDLVSQPDIIERLLAHGKLPIAAWPIIDWTYEGGPRLFYDTWAFHKDGRLFYGNRPHHPAWLEREGDVFEVDGFGSVWLAEASDLRNLVVETEAVREICSLLKAKGRTLWVDCSLSVFQPTGLLELNEVTPLRT